MAALLPTLQYSSSSSWLPNKKLLYSTSCFPSSLSKTHLSLALISKPKSKRLNFYVKAEKESESSGSSSSVAVVSEESKNENAEKGDLHVGGELGKGTESESEKNEVERKSGLDSDAELAEKEKQQELDWKTDEEFKKFLGNPSIEAAIKLEKKRTDTRLKELDRETSDNPIVGLFNRLVRDSLSREKERLEKAEEAFKALNLNKLRSCFGFDTFFATDVRRFGDGGIFIGNLRKPIEEVIPKLERKLSEAAGTEVVVWFMEEKTNDITKQACVVQPKSEIHLQFEATNLNNFWGYLSAVALCITTFGTIALTSGFFVKPDATIDDYLRDVVPLFGGFLTILGVSEEQNFLCATFCYVFSANLVSKWIPVVYSLLVP